MGSQAGGNGFRDCGSSWPQLDAVRDHYCGNPLRIMIASMAIMMNHVHMAAPTLKKEIPIESKKMAGIVKPLIRKKRTMAGSCALQAADRSLSSTSVWLSRAACLSQGSRRRWPPAVGGRRTLQGAPWGREEKPRA